jgi:hypothetical protein
MARLLTLQSLYHFDDAVGSFISLERIFEQSKESYYETLEASSQGWHEGERVRAEILKRKLSGKPQNGSVARSTIGFPLRRRRGRGGLRFVLLGVQATT